MFLSHHFLIRGQDSPYLNDGSLVPPFEERILGIGRPGDQRASSSTAKCSPSLFIRSDDVCDKRAGRSWRDVEEGSAEDAAPNDMAFLPLHKHADTHTHTQILYTHTHHKNTHKFIV